MNEHQELIVEMLEKQKDCALKSENELEICFEKSAKIDAAIEWVKGQGSTCIDINNKNNVLITNTLRQPAPKLPE